MAPLPRRASRSWRGLDLKPVIALIMIAAASVGVYLFILVPQSKLLADARDALCGGNVDFVASVAETGVVVSFSPSENFGRHVSDSFGHFYEYRAFRGLIENTTESHADLYGGSSSDLAYGFSGGRFSVDGRQEQNIIEATNNLNLGCYDLDYPGSMAFPNKVWPSLSNIIASEISKEALTSDLDYEGGKPTPINSCAELWERCGEESTVGIRARQFCPNTCGCMNPASMLALFAPEHGCPSTEELPDGCGPPLHVASTTAWPSNMRRC